MPSFTHLHVASGYSLRHGAAPPAALVERAAELGMEALALTDRDGLYGAVKFVQACVAAELAPIVGVDLAVEPSGLLGGSPGGSPGGSRSGSRSEPAGEPPDRPRRFASTGRPVRAVPVRGGAGVDPRHPRVTALALAASSEAGATAAGSPEAGGSAPGAGWGRLCRLVTATHARGERGRPVSTVELVATHAADPVEPGRPALVVLLGPASEFGAAVLSGRRDLAIGVLQHWRALLPPGALAVEVVNHRGPRGALASRMHAARSLALARECGVPAVLTNAVRHLDRDDAVTVDVLDAARRLVPLGARHLDRTTAEGYLAGPAEMAARAREIADAAGEDDAGRRLLRDTAELAARCRLDPPRDLRMWQAQLPELHVFGFETRADAARALRGQCEQNVLLKYPAAADRPGSEVRRRLEEELRLIEHLEIPEYFLAVQKVCGLIRKLGGRVAARGSGAGSLVNHLLGISGVDPMQHGLLMERFLTIRRAQLPDIDLDVESHRREEIYRKILGEFGAERVTCVSMMDTYRVRHAVRDVGAALGLPPGETDTIAKAFPHIRARDVRLAIAELPELRSAGLDSPRLRLLFDLVERLDGLPRHIALHPCGVIISNAQLLDRTPVEASWQGFPMSQFDKDDVETMGLLKLDVLGIRMQSAMAHAIGEVERVDGAEAARAGQHPPGAAYLDGAGRITLDSVPLDDEPTFEMIRTTRTLGCFQIESPGQRELIGKFGPESFEDLIIDISLYRPGPVQSDMITPFLRARQGFDDIEYIHPELKFALESTAGVVVFHEQVLQIVDALTGCGLDVADEVRRAMGSPAGQADVHAWLKKYIRREVFDEVTQRRVWDLLVAFASFGFCKAHAAAFALPTYQSAWLKTHHPAAFLAGVLTHDPGMYPKRLILDDARNLGIAVLPLDVNTSDETYRVERVERGYGIRLSLADVKGISKEEVAAVVAGRPYHSLADFWQRAESTRPVTERLVLAGGFDAVHGIGPGLPFADRHRLTRRDLFLQVGELDRWTPRRSRDGQLALDLTGERADERADEARHSGLPELTDAERLRIELDVLGLDASRHVMEFYAPMLESLGVTRAPDLLGRRSRSELLVAGVKVATQTPPIRGGRRVVFLTIDDAAGPIDATFFEDVQGAYAGTVFHSWLLLVRGVLRKAGRRGVTLRATGAWELPVLWEIWSSGGPQAVLDLIRSEPGAGSDHDPWRAAGERSRTPAGLPATAFGGGVAVPGAPAPNWEVAAGVPVGDRSDARPNPAAARAHPEQDQRERAGGMGGGAGHSRVLVHASGFRQSPYADLKPPGDDVRDTRRNTPPPRRPGERSGADRPDTSAPRKLWHSSPGSSGG